MKEQRWYIRYKIEGRANLKPEGKKSGAIKTNLIDISYKGFAAYANEQIAGGTEVCFWLITKLWDEPIIGRGKVKYAQEIKRDEQTIFRLGIEFVEIDKKILQSIINYIVQDMCAAVKKRAT